MKQRITAKGWLAQTGGVALIAVGLGAFLLGILTDIHINGGTPVALMLAGGQLMIIGTILCCYQQLLIRSIPNENSLQYQYDMGYENGWRERGQHGRPVVVDFDAHRAGEKVIERV